MKQQVAWLYRGTSGVNETSWMISDYFERKTLAELGFKTDLDELEQFEIDYLTIISVELNKLKLMDQKRSVSQLNRKK